MSGFAGIVLPPENHANNPSLSTKACSAVIIRQVFLFNKEWKFQNSGQGTSVGFFFRGD
jgi:hypothetical protein